MPAQNIDPATATQWVQLAGTVATTAISVLAALAAAAVPLIPVVLPLVRERVKDARSRRAFDAVSRAGTIAATAYAEALRAELEAARRPESPGGAEVTPDEHKRAMSKAVAIGWDVLTRDGLREGVVTYYGSEDLAKASIREKVLAKTDADVAAPDEPRK